MFLQKPALLMGLVAGGILLASAASAHVVVQPGQAAIGAWQTFTVGVPNEKNSPTIGVRLVMPDGLDYVTPNVKPGWLVTVKKDPKSGRVAEISWSRGSIPVGLRDEFYFNAQLPAQETTLNWKAYQTYLSGQVVAWDQDLSAAKPAAKDNESIDVHGMNTPFSRTKVVNDLNVAPVITTETASAGPSNSGDGAISLSIVAIMISVVSLGLGLAKASGKPDNQGGQKI